MDIVGVVDTINGAEDADAAGFADAERARRASGAETAAVEGCVAGSEGAAGSASMGGEPVVHDSDALIFRNGIEQDMTPLERAVYKARIAPVIDADARLQTLAKTAEGIRVSCGLPMMQADRVRRIELRLRERFVLGGELGVYSGAETSTWLRQERSRLHSDYWLLDLLALRLAEMFPKQSAPSRAKTKSTVEAKANDVLAARPQTVGVTRDDCYSMLLPMAVKTDDLSGKNGNGYAKALWENKKLSEDAAEKEGCFQAYEEYLENPLAVVRGKMLVRVPGEAFSEEDPWHVLLWHFFFDEATDTEIEEFVAALKDALIHDAAVTGSSEYVASTARAYVVKRLLASAAARGDGWDARLSMRLVLCCAGCSTLNAPTTNRWRLRTTACLRAAAWRLLARSRRRAARFRLTHISLTALHASTSKRVVSCAFIRGFARAWALDMRSRKTNATSLGAAARNSQAKRHGVP